MVQIDVTYEGVLRCRAVHGPSGSELLTDAPTDNQGKGETFSPTDLVATAIGSCILTIMGIVAQRHDWRIEGARAVVNKVMIADPARRIEKLEVLLKMPPGLDERQRRTLEKAALTCPVHKSIEGGIEIPLRFEWD